MLSASGLCVCVSSSCFVGDFLKVLPMDFDPARYLR